MSNMGTFEDVASEVLCRRVSELRKKNKLTLDQLASLSGVSRSMLSQIERGKANPTLAVTFRIAQAFGMNLAELLEQPGSHSAIDVVHGDDPRHLFPAGDGCRIRTLSPLHMEKDVEFYEICIAEKTTLHSAAHFNGARELLTLTQGKAQVRSANNECLLMSGDSAHYRADVEHSIENIGDGELIGFLVVTYQS